MHPIPPTFALPEFQTLTGAFIIDTALIMPLLRASAFSAPSPRITIHWHYFLKLAAWALTVRACLSVYSCFARVGSSRRSNRYRQAAADDRVQAFEAIVYVDCDTLIMEGFNQVTSPLQRKSPCACMRFCNAQRTARASTSLFNCPFFTFSPPYNVTGQFELACRRESRHCRHVANRCQSLRQREQERSAGALHHTSSPLTSNETHMLCCCLCAPES